MSATNALANRDDGAILEKVVTQGDLAALNPKERTAYYQQLCEQVGLSWVSQPFAYLKLNGKLVLYAQKSATDQLRAIHDVSIYKIEKEQEGDLYIVTAYARNGKGREDVDMGATNTKGLSGDALVNARLKAITKAKRRVTLSLCGLGFLDESEVETIPGARPVESTMQGEIIDATPEPARAPLRAVEGAVECERQSNEPLEPATAADQLRADCKMLVVKLSALGHPTFKKGEGQAGRIMKHLKDAVDFFQWDVDAKLLSGLADLTEGELRDYKGMLEQEQEWQTRKATEQDVVF